MPPRVATCYNCNRLLHSTPSPNPTADSGLPLGHSSSFLPVVGTKVITRRLAVERVEGERRRLAGIVARADQQHAWVTAGDERGVYGEYPAATV